MRLGAVWLLGVWMAGAAGMGRAEPEVVPAGIPDVDGMYRENLEKYKDNPDWLVRRGLVADRKEKRIVLQARATGLGPNEIVEFFLIGEDGGHGYEAVALSYARPVAIHEALEFIGMAPGKGVNSDDLRFWSKGERVIVTFRSADAGKKYGTVRAETLVIDAKTKQPLPQTGLLFTGSRTVKMPDPKGGEAYAADRFEPFSIASNYNEPMTLLDIPRQASQGDVYNTQLCNPDYRFETGERLEVVMEPEYKDGRKRVMDLDLHASLEPGAAAGPGNLTFSLKQTGGAVQREQADWGALLESFTQLRESGHDLFVAVHFAEPLPVSEVCRLCELLGSIDVENGIRIDPPPSGHLYYRAFLPDEKNRGRDRRISQPWELHLKAQEGVLSGTLVQIKQIWQEKTTWPALEVTEYKVDGPEALRRELEEREQNLRVIFVFCAPTLTYGQVMSFLRPVLPTYRTVYVFTDLPEPATETTAEKASPPVAGTEN